MKKIGIILLITLVLVIITWKMMTKPAEKMAELELMTTYQLDEEIASVAYYFVQNDRLYLLDTFSKAVFILSDSFETIVTLNKTGQGPGEFGFPLFMYNDISAEQFVVADYDRFMDMRFDYDGNYVEQNPVELLKSCIKQEKAGDAIIANFFGIDVEKQLNFSSISLINNDVVKLLFIHSDSMKDFMFPLYTSSHENVYIWNYSKEKYEIKVIDFKGENTANITKNYSKVQETDIEKEYSNLYSSSFGNETDDSKEKSFHIPIRKLLCYEGKLWALTQSQEASFFDVYDENHVLITQYRINNSTVGDFFVFNDSLCEFKIDKDGYWQVNCYKKPKFSN
jgi:hypothetical protein